MTKSEKLSAIAIGIISGIAIAYIQKSKQLERLNGIHARARDLRGGAALVLAALAAEGETVISDVHLIDRGYARMEETLSRLGADIRRVSLTD